MKKYIYIVYICFNLNGLNLNINNNVNGAFNYPKNSLLASLKERQTLNKINRYTSQRYLPFCEEINVGTFKPNHKEEMTNLVAIVG